VLNSLLEELTFGPVRSGPVQSGPGFNEDRYSQGSFNNDKLKLPIQQFLHAYLRLVSALRSGPRLSYASEKWCEDQGSTLYSYCNDLIYQAITSHHQTHHRIVRTFNLAVYHALRRWACKIRILVCTVDTGRLSHKKSYCSWWHDLWWNKVFTWNASRNIRACIMILARSLWATKNKLLSSQWSYFLLQILY